MTDPASGIAYYLAVQTPEYRVASLNDLNNTPIGAATTFQSAGQVIPAIGEDMGYLVWRKRNCCAL